METLNVITVPAADLDNPGKLLIVYTVYSEAAGALRASAGWTLKDAIEYYSRDNGIDRAHIRTNRQTVLSGTRFPKTADGLVTK